MNLMNNLQVESFKKNNAETLNKKLKSYVQSNLKNVHGTLKKSVALDGPVIDQEIAHLLISNFQAANLLLGDMYKNIHDQNLSENARKQISVPSRASEKNMPDEKTAEQFKLEDEIIKISNNRFDIKNQLEKIKIEMNSIIYQSQHTDGKPITMRTYIIFL
jgi:hypothetical protein